MRKCATLKTDFLLWKQQFSSRSWVFCGVRGSGGSCRAWKLHDWAPEIWVDVLPQTWFSEVAHSQTIFLRLPILLRGSLQLKPKVIHEVKTPPFPTTAKGKQALPRLRLTVTGVAPLLLLWYPRNEWECRQLRAAESPHLLRTAQRLSCIKEIVSSV